jgi:hypothetical protein
MLMTRTSAVLVGGGLLTALIASPALLTTRTAAPTETVRPFASRDVASDAGVVRLEALLSKRPARAQTTATSRNPFVFATRPAPPTAAPASSPAPAIVEAPPEPPRPPISLAAIAEQIDDGGARVRTAVLSVAGQVFLVKEGERISSRFTVTRISADVVELRDDMADAPIRLALR